MLSCCTRFIITVIQLFNDEELVYLYRQGNDWAYKELQNKFWPIICKGVLTSKKEMGNLGFDEAECLSQCQYTFYQCFDYYCEHKEASFASYVCVKLQYAIRNYERKLYRKNNFEYSMDALLDSNPILKVCDYQSNPQKMIDFKDFMSELKLLSRKSVGLEKLIITCLIAGYNTQEMHRDLPYDKKTINNALYRIRKKLKNMEKLTIKSEF